MTKGIKPNGHGSDDPWGTRYGLTRVETVVGYLNESRLATIFKWTFKFVPGKNVIEASQLRAINGSIDGLIVLELGVRPIMECDKPPVKCKSCVYSALIDAILAIEEDNLNDPGLEDTILAELAMNPLTEEEEADVTELLNIDVDVIRFNDPKTELKLYPPWVDNPDVLN